MSAIDACSSVSMASKLCQNKSCRSEVMPGHFDPHMGKLGQSCIQTCSHLASVHSSSLVTKHATCVHMLVGGGMSDTMLRLVAQWPHGWTDK